MGMFDLKEEKIRQEMINFSRSMNTLLKSGPEFFHHDGMYTMYLTKNYAIKMQPKTWGPGNSAAVWEASPRELIIGDDGRYVTNLPDDWYYKQTDPNNELSYLVLPPKHHITNIFDEICEMILTYKRDPMKIDSPPWKIPERVKSRFELLDL